MLRVAGRTHIAAPVSVPYAYAYDPHQRLRDKDAGTLGYNENGILILLYVRCAPSLCLCEADVLQMMHNTTQEPVDDEQPIGTHRVLSTSIRLGLQYCRREPDASLAGGETDISDDGTYCQYTVDDGAIATPR
jgi:hypothetical protein